MARYIARPVGREPLNAQGFVEYSIKALKFQDIELVLFRSTLSSPMFKVFETRKRVSKQSAGGLLKKIQPLLPSGYECWLDDDSAEGGWSVGISRL